MPIHKHIMAACTKLHTDFPDSHFVIVAVSKKKDGGNHWNLHSDLPSTEIAPLVRELSEILQRNVVADTPTQGSA